MELSPVVFALIGTALGGAITLIGNWIQNKSQTAREYIKIAHELAKYDYEKMVEHAEPGQKVLPLESFTVYYVRFVKLLRDKNFRVEQLTELREFREQIFEFYAKEIGTEIKYGG